MYEFFLTVDNSYPSQNHCRIFASELVILWLFTFVLVKSKMFTENFQTIHIKQQKWFPENLWLNDDYLVDTDL